MVEANDLAELLNKLHSIDPGAASALVSYRANCNEAMTAAVVPFVCSIDADGKPRIGIVGVLNALASAGSGRVSAVYDKSHKLTGFTVVVI